MPESSQSLELYVAGIGFLGAIIGAVVGGFLAGHFSRQATRDLLNEQRKLQREEKKHRVKALLSALKNEVRSVWTHYMEGTGKYIESVSPNAPCKFYFPITGDYFPIYAGNVGSLGLITDDLLRHQIISTFTLARSLIDSYRLNNDLYQESEAAISEAFYKGSIGALQVSKVKEQNLNAYAPSLKAMHVKVKKAVEELIETLDMWTIEEPST